MGWYRQGTASVANGSTAVTGTLTAWTSQAKAEDRITFDGGSKWYEVASVESNTALTLATPFGEATVTDGAYAIDRSGRGWDLVSDLAARVAALLAMFPVLGGAGDALKWFRANAAGTAFEFTAATPATITVGSTTTGAPGSSASVANSGTSSDAVLDFTIPRGDPGPAGVNWITGGWLTATGYVARDVVKHNGSSYICTSGHTSGATTEPGVGVDWATVWDLVAQKGDQGDPGPTGVNWITGGWLTATAYAARDAVEHNGSSYICTSGHTSGATTEPGTGVSWETVWDLLAEKGADGAGSGDVTAATAFGATNRLIASDGAGKGVQATAIKVAYGPSGGGDSTALNTIFAAASGGSCIIPPGTYSIDTQLSIPANTHALAHGAILTKAGNIDMITMAGSSKLIGATIQGAGATYSGDGVVVTTGNWQELIDCTILDMQGYCVDVDNDVGIGLTIQGGLYQRTTASNSAIRFANGGTTESNGDRHVIGVSAGGGNLIDTAGSQTTMMVNCNMANLTTHANTRKLIMTGCRVASATADINFSGADHSISGNVFAGDAVLVSGLATSVFEGNTFASGYTYDDQAGVASNVYHGSAVSVAATWKGDTSDPAIGNGTITFDVSRDGKYIVVNGLVSMGSTTTYGTGNWYFTLPSPFAMNASGSARYLGSVRVFDAGTAILSGVCYINGGTNQIRFVGHNVGNDFNSTNPITWASGDDFSFTLRYPVA